MEPVGLAQNLSPERVMRAQIGETDLAVWRSASGKLSAWGNRCPHRGMRLSYGFVRGESLACAYHGWHYDCQGSCHYIPAHPELDPPDTIKPQIYAVTERAGVIWVSTDSQSTPVELPEGYIGVRSIALDCSFHTAGSAFSTVALASEDGINLSASEQCKKPGVIALGTDENSESVFILIQQRSPDSVVGHILAHKSWSVQSLVQISRWSEAVRREAERNHDSN